VDTKLRLRKEVPQGAEVPQGWRRAWHEPKRHVDVFSPWPLHWVLRFGRELLHRIRVAINAPPIELAETLEMQRHLEERQHPADEYSRGYLVGWRECFEDCLAAAKAEVDDAAYVWDVGDSLGELFAAKHDN